MNILFHPQAPPLQPPIMGVGGGERSVMLLKPLGPNFLVPLGPLDPPLGLPPPPPPPWKLLVIGPDPPMFLSSFLAGLSSIPTKDLKNNTKKVINFHIIFEGVGALSSTTSPRLLMYTISGWIREELLSS